MGYDLNFDIDSKQGKALQKKLNAMDQDDFDSELEQIRDAAEEDNVQHDNLIRAIRTGWKNRNKPAAKPAAAATTDIVKVTATRRAPEPAAEDKLPTVGNMVTLKLKELDHAPKESASVETWISFAHQQNQYLTQIEGVVTDLACEASPAMWYLGQALTILSNKAKHGTFTAIKKRLGVKNGTYDRSTKLFKAVKDPKKLIGVKLTAAYREYGIIEAKPAAALPAPADKPKPRQVMDELDDMLVQWDQKPEEVSSELIDLTERNLQNSLKAIAKIKEKRAKNDPAAITFTGKPATTREVAQATGHGLTAKELKVVKQVMQISEHYPFRPKTFSIAKRQLWERVRNRCKQNPDIVPAGLTGDGIADKIKAMAAAQIDTLLPLIVVGPQQSAKIGG